MQLCECQIEPQASEERHFITLSGRLIPQRYDITNALYKCTEYFIFISSNIDGVRYFGTFLILASIELYKDESFQYNTLVSVPHHEIIPILKFEIKFNK